MGRRSIIVAAASLTSGVGVAWVMFANEVRTSSVLDVILVLVVGWSFIGAGLLAWQLKPGNSIGTAMIVTGFLRFLAALAQSQNVVLFAGGHALEVAYLAGVIYVVLAFPRGRLENTFHRGLFGLAIFAVGPLDIARLVFGGHDPQSCVGCPTTLVIEVVNAPGIARALELALFGLGAVVAVSAFAVLIRRWQRASPRLRFAIAPVLWVGAASFVAVFLMVTNHFLEEPAGDAPHVLLDVVTASVAFAFLVGLGRTRLARSAVADLVIELGNTPGPGELRAALARTLRDPSLDIVYWLPGGERYVDADGRPIELPLEGGERSVTVVRRDDHIIAALLHDPALREDAQLVESVCAAAGLAMENERLQAELRARLEELSASRTRIVEAAQAERRRIERDLHDGSQQRLVSVAMTLGLADSKLTSDPVDAQTFLREARTGLTEALEDLRELSSGIYPGILTERGLAPALEDLAARCRMPVELVVSLPQRLPDQIETAAYFVASEALTNAAKHAPASTVQVRVDQVDGQIAIQVRDDGPGGADPSRGSGLGGLRDRIEALGGRFTLTSPPGAGTILEAEIPCG
ncbi:MAG TPA: sensor histidine kinase [Jiangellaceae bacterium]